MGKRLFDWTDTTLLRRHELRVVARTNKYQFILNFVEIVEGPSLFGPTDVTLAFRSVRGHLFAHGSLEFVGHALYVGASQAQVQRQGNESIAGAGSVGAGAMRAAIHAVQGVIAVVDAGINLGLVKCAYHVITVIDQHLIQVPRGFERMETRPIAAMIELP